MARFRVAPSTYTFRHLTPLSYLIFTHKTSVRNLLGFWMANSMWLAHVSGVSGVDAREEMGVGKCDGNDEVD